MFGKPTSTGTKTVLTGLLMTVAQTMLTRRVAGRAAGVAARGGGGIPGLLLWMGISYAFNKYMAAKHPTVAAPPAPGNRQTAGAR